MIAREQDVLRLDVTVDDTLPMRVAQGIGDLERDPDGISQRELRFTGESLPERLARDIWHRVPQGLHRTARLLRCPAIEDRQDVGVLEAGGDLDLLHKALGAERMGQLLVQDLEGDSAIVPEIARQVDSSHAAPAELALEQVAVAEGIRQW